MQDKKLINNILKSEDIIRKRSITGSGNFLIINSTIGKSFNNIVKSQELLKERTKKIKKLKRIINENNTNNRW